MMEKAGHTTRRKDDWQHCQALQWAPQGHREREDQWKPGEENGRKMCGQQL